MRLKSLYCSRGDSSIIVEVLVVKVNKTSFGFNVVNAFDLGDAS